MQALKIAVRALCVIPFVTGITDLFDGVGLLTLAGVPLAGVARDPILNSQIAFWGAIWFGFGLTLWRASSRLRDETTLFYLLCGVFALSGLARLGAAVRYGLPGPVLTTAMALELVAGLGLILWHRILSRRSSAV